VVTRVVEFGWTPTQTAEGVGVSRATVYKWLRRFREEGQAGLPGSEPPDPAVPHVRSPAGESRRSSLCAGTASPGFPIWTGPPGR